MSLLRRQDNSSTGARFRMLHSSKTCRFFCQLDSLTLMSSVSLNYNMLSPTLTCRKSIVLVLAMLCISLTALGIRLPWAPGISSGKVKPRPRAIVQNQIKNCKENVLKSLAVEPALPAPIFIPSHIETANNTPLIYTPGKQTATVLIAKFSRAPPVGKSVKA